MATFDFSGILPQFKALISSALLRNRFNDLKTHINTLNPSGLILPSTVGANNEVLESNGDGTTSWVSFSGLTDGDKGDITVTSTGSVWTIDNNAVTQIKSSFTTTTKTTTYTAVANDYILADTSSAAWTLTFPASATAGNKIYIVDYKNTFDTKNLTINPNGLNIENQSSNLVLDIKGFTGMYQYIDATIGWKKI